MSATASDTPQPAPTGSAPAPATRPINLGKRDDLMYLRAAVDMAPLIAYPPSLGQPLTTQWKAILHGLIDRALLVADGGERVKSDEH